MFSKNRPSESEEKKNVTSTPATPPTRPASPPSDSSSASTSTGPTANNKPKPAPSILSSDLTVTGHMSTTGDIQVEGTVEGDIKVHLLTVGENATIKGEIVADDVVVTGRVVGRVRGLKVRLTSSARVEGDIVHKTIAIESGAHFEGSVQRNEDPLKNAESKPKAAATATATGS